MEAWGPDAVERLSPDQMDGWEAFNEVEPIGLEKVCSILAKGFMHLLACKGVKLDDDYFMPWRAAERPEQTAEEQIAICRMTAAGG